MSDEIGARGVINYLREKKSLWIIAAALVIGVCLMLWGTSDIPRGVPSDVESLEARVEALCERIEGVSEISVMIRTDTLGQVRGAAVVCRGGDNVSVQLTITDMLCALFGIGADSVSVVGGK